MTPAAVAHNCEPTRPGWRRLLALAASASVLLMAASVLQPGMASAASRPTATTYGFALSSYESVMLGDINGQRAAAGLPPLLLAGGGTDIARRWASKLADAGSLSHNPSLGPELDSLGSSGWTVAGENVASGGAAGAVVAGWMASAPHRANILNPKFKFIGVGAVTRTGRTWISTEFSDVADGRAPTTSPDTGVEMSPPPSGVRIAAVDSSGALIVKEGGLYASWTTVATGVSAQGLDGIRVGAVTGGAAIVKEGALSSTWTTVADGVKEIVLASGRIAVLGIDGSVRVKEGGISSTWTTVWSGGATSVAMSGSRIAVISGGTLLVKEGSLFAGWATIADGATDAALAGERVAAVVGGIAYAKQGSLFSGWVALASATRITLSNDRIGVIDGTAAIVKDGLFSSWTVVANTAVTALSVTPSRVAVVDAGTVLVKEGALTSSWVALTTAPQVALTS